jgi:uncharacterized membrane protein YgcG
MAIVVHCPQCSVRLTLCDDRMGTTFECPKCEQPITIPILNPEPIIEAEPSKPPLIPQSWRKILTKKLTTTQKVICFVIIGIVSGAVLIGASKGSALAGIKWVFSCFNSLIILGLFALCVFGISKLLDRYPWLATVFLFIAAIFFVTRGNRSRRNYGRSLNYSGDGDDAIDGSSDYGGGGDFGEGGDGGGDGGGGGE